MLRAPLGFWDHPRARFWNRASEPGWEPPLGAVGLNRFRPTALTGSGTAVRTVENRPLGIAQTCDIYQNLAHGIAGG